MTPDQVSLAVFWLLCGLLLAAVLVQWWEGRDHD